MAGGTSRINLYNMSAAITLIENATKAGVMTPHDVGIVTPYAGQVDQYHQVFHRMSGDYRHISVGTAEFWHGNQAQFVIADCVRATNDRGINGFFASAKRLCLMLSRQKQVLVVIGGEGYTEPASFDDGDKAGNASRKKMENDNKAIKATFQWLINHGRKVDVAVSDLDETWVHFTTNMIDEPTDTGYAMQGGDAVDGAAGFIQIDDQSKQHRGFYTLHDCRQDAPRLL